MIGTVNDTMTQHRAGTKMAKIKPTLDPDLRLLDEEEEVEVEVEVDPLPVAVNTTFALLAVGETNTYK